MENQQKPVYSAEALRFTLTWLVKQSQSPAYWTDPLQHIRACNTAFKEALQVNNNSTCRACSYHDFLDDDSCYQLLKHNTAVISEERFLFQEKYVLKENNHVWESEIHKVPFYAGSEFVGILHVAFSTKKATEAPKQPAAPLTRSNVYLSNIVRNMPGSIYWKDKDGVFLGCNQFVADMAGVSSPEEVIGKTDKELIWKSIADTIRENDLLIMQSQQEHNFEEHIALPDRSQEMIMLTHKAPLFDDQGEVIGVLGVSIDVTDRKKLEANLAETKVREANFKAMSALGGIMAHELKTPLMSIALDANSIKEYFPTLVKAYREYSKVGKIPEIRKRHLELLEDIVDRMEVSARYAGNTIDTILSGFRYSASTSITLEEIEVNEIVQKALNDYPLNEEEKSLITFNATKKYSALGVPNIIIHVIHNLLKNALYAIQAVKKGTITISLEKTKEGSVLIQFQDTAKGIPEKIREHIFDAFYTTKDSETSTGLGLYFCKMALEKMEASITCQSEEGKYTLFTIKLKGLPAKHK